MTSCRVSRSMASMRSRSASSDVGDLGGAAFADGAGGGLRDGAVGRPWLRRRAPRCRTRCGSGSRGPKCGSFRGGRSAEPSLLPAVYRTTMFGYAWRVSRSDKNWRRPGDTLKRNIGNSLLISAQLWPEFVALLQVLLIDSGAGWRQCDRGGAWRSTGCPSRQRRRAIVFGVARGDAAADRVRAGDAAAAGRSIGLLLAGGVLLLWVCWRMYRELRRGTGRP